jgi:multicomponent K+:H+ antiporter subunit F
MIAPDRLYDIALVVAFVAVALSQILAMIRLIMGPGVSDRILALDTMVVDAIALIVLLGIAQGTQIYFEAALIFAMLGFVSTVAYARFILRGDIIE